MLRVLLMRLIEYEIIHRGPDTCRRCSGTGRFVRANLNGKPAGPGGECFRCEGKGYQTKEDSIRNAAYDRHACAQALREMVGA